MISLTINANHGIDFPMKVMQTMTPNDITSLLNESINLNGEANNSSNTDEDLILAFHKNISYEYIHNGRILNSYLSLASQGVTNGSKLDIITNININTIHHQNNITDQTNHCVFHSTNEDSAQNNSVCFSNANNLFPKLTENSKRLLRLQLLENKAKTFSTQSEKIASLLTESFRIYDSHFSSIERYPRSQISYQRMLQMVHNETEDEPDPEPEMIDEVNFNDLNCFTNGTNIENGNKSIITDSTKEPSTSPLPPLNLNSEYDESEEFDEFIMAPMFESIEQAGKLFAKNPWSEWTW